MSNVRGRGLAYNNCEYDIRLNSDYTSESIIIGGARCDVSTQLFIYNSASLKGTFRLQASNNPSLMGWENLCLGTTDGYAIVDSNVSKIFEMPGYSSGYMRAKFEYESGDGYADISILIKRR
jgi:hypothetical protein